MADFCTIFLLSVERLVVEIGAVSRVMLEDVQEQFLKKKLKIPRWEFLKEVLDIFLDEFPTKNLRKICEEIALGVSEAVMKYKFWKILGSNFRGIILICCSGVIGEIPDEILSTA